MDNICLSGGAKGADLLWGYLSGLNGYTVIHWSFDGHQSLAPESELCRLGKEYLESQEVSDIIKIAAKKLKKNVPYKPFVRKLIQRNYYQIRDSSKWYGVGYLENAIIQGGTAWSFEMMKELHPDSEKWFYDQTTEKWYGYTDSWIELSEDPPKPIGIFTGVGTRELVITGKEALKRLMDYGKLTASESQ